MLLDLRQCVQLDSIHANNADDMQVHGDTRAACDSDGVMNVVRWHVTRRFVKTMTWMIPDSKRPRASRCWLRLDSVAHPSANGCIVDHYMLV